MKTFFKTIPRKFSVGKDNEIEISDFGKIHLDPNEMLSFVTSSGKEFDFTAKEWGFYATPSMNGRLKKEGFKSALVKNTYGKYYVMVAEEEKVNELLDYLEKENQTVVEWLDEK